jgi:hypothetical protein
LGLAWLQYAQDYDDVTIYTCYGNIGNSNSNSSCGATAGIDYNGPWVSNPSTSGNNYPHGHGTSPGFLLDPYIKSSSIWRCPSDFAGNSNAAVWQTGTEGAYAGGFENASYGYKSTSSACRGLCRRAR